MVILPALRREDGYGVMLMAQVIKRRTQVYEITQTSYPDSLGMYEAFAATRTRMLGLNAMHGLNRCFDCGQAFGAHDKVYLALVKGHKNRFLCGPCAKRHKEGE